MTKKKKNQPKNFKSMVIPVSEHLNDMLTGDPLETRPTPADEPGKELNHALDLISQSFKHCEEFIDDPTQPECLRKFLERARQPAHGMLSKEPYPKLFATYQGEGWRGVAKGDRVRVVMASRLGDVGCTKNLEADSGYQLRTSVDNLSDFSDTPF